MPIILPNTNSSSNVDQPMLDSVPHFISGRNYLACRIGKHAKSRYMDESKQSNNKLLRQAFYGIDVTTNSLVAMYVEDSHAPPFSADKSIQLARYV